LVGDGAGVEERTGLDSMFKRFIPGAIGEDRCVDGALDEAEGGELEVEPPSKMSFWAPLKKPYWSR